MHSWNALSAMLYDQAEALEEKKGIPMYWTSSHSFLLVLDGLAMQYKTLELSNQPGWRELPLGFSAQI